VKIDLNGVQNSDFKKGRRSLLQYTILYIGQSLFIPNNARRNPKTSNKNIENASKREKKRVKLVAYKIIA
jgi:hypothetical protein